MTKEIRLRDTTDGSVAGCFLTFAVHANFLLGRGIPTPLTDLVGICNLLINN